MVRPISLAARSETLRDLSLLTLISRGTLDVPALAARLRLDPATVALLCDHLVSQALLQADGERYATTGEVDRLLAQAGSAPAGGPPRLLLMSVALVALIPALTLLAAARPRASVPSRPVPAIAAAAAAKAGTGDTEDAGPAFCLVSSREQAAAQVKQWLEERDLQAESEVLDAGESALPAWAILSNSSAPVLVITASVQQEVHVREVVASANMIRTSGGRSVITIVELRPSNAGQ
jgi:hypothetical protein